MGNRVGAWPVIDLRVWHVPPSRQPSLFPLSFIELRFFHPYVPLADAKTVDYFVIFPVGLRPEGINSHTGSGVTLLNPLPGEGKGCLLLTRDFSFQLLSMPLRDKKQGMYWYSFIP